MDDFDDGKTSAIKQYLFFDVLLFSEIVQQPIRPNTLKGNIIERGNEWVLSLIVMPRKYKF
jgi:hypothetical protein